MPNLYTYVYIKWGKNIFILTNSITFVFFQIKCQTLPVNITFERYHLTDVMLTEY